MNFDAVFLALFLVFLIGFVFIKRHNIQVQKILYPLIYVIMYRTKLGLKLMDKLAKKDSKVLKFLGYVSIAIGFIGMAFLCYSLIETLFKSLIKPTAGVALVLPFQVKGTLYVPFSYWIISIVIIAAVHEFMHGVYARLAKVKIISSGFAFISLLVPILPAAFVEPEEKVLQKKSLRERLAVFSAGPFANMLLAGIMFLLFISVGGFIAKSTLAVDGIQLTDFIKENNMTYPAETSGLAKGDIIRQVQGIPVPYVVNFSNMLKGKAPGDTVSIGTDKGTYDMTLAENPANKSLPYLGVYIKQNIVVNQTFEKKYGKPVTSVLLWLNGKPDMPGLIYWLVVLNLGIGLFNLVPIGPIDGGRMLDAVLHRRFKKEKAMKIMKAVSTFFLILIFFNLALGFIIK